ncbi:NAD-dependent epimerase/dehydratase family protein [Kocuria rosea]|uniref:NAD-dependent epimerase/dehydratase family protein n=1 Tax=Kocuria rosea TaxID=1275 RepID=UPI0034D97C27
MSCPILVTGATGNVGAPVVAMLRAQGTAVRPAARRPTNSRSHTNARSPDTCSFARSAS